MFDGVLQRAGTLDKTRGSNQPCQNTPYTHNTGREKLREKKRGNNIMHWTGISALTIRQTEGYPPACDRPNPDPSNPHAFPLSRRHNPPLICSVQGSFSHTSTSLHVCDAPRRHECQKPTAVLSSGLRGYQRNGDEQVQPCTSQAERPDSSNLSIFSFSASPLNSPA